MSEVFITTKPRVGDPEVYQLTCTTDVSITVSGEVSNNPMQSRRNVSDNYSRNAKVVSFSGLISNVSNWILTTKSDRPQRTVPENVRLLEALADSGDTFILSIDNNLEPLDDCVFTSISFVKSSGMGTSYNVDATVKQILKSSQVSLSLERVNQTKEVNNQSGSLESSGNATTKEVGNSRALLLTLKDTIVGLFSGSEEDATN